MPRVVVHDKASHMVSPNHNRLHCGFAAALRNAGFRSWVGDEAAPADWLVARWGDVYLHETAIAHGRRLLNTTYACRRVGETVGQFRTRLDKVEAHMNSDEFDAGGGGLEALAKELRARCEEVVRRKGERLPK